MKIYLHGKPQPGFLAANHTSYLDPIVVQAIKTGGAVSKIEVKDYFGRNGFMYACERRNFKIIILRTELLMEGIVGILTKVFILI